MNFDRFKFRASVDWLEVEFWTTKATIAWRIQEKCGFSWVSGLNPCTGAAIDGPQGENTPTVRFRGRLQSPERFSAVEAALTCLESLDPTSPVLVREIEVSFDGFPLPGTTREELAELAAEFVHSVNRVSEAWPRIYRRTGETAQALEARLLKTALLDGFTVGIGDEDADRYQRAYCKLDNAFEGQRISLPPEQCSARLEIRLQNAALPAKTLEDLKGFNFSSVSMFFRFIELTSEVEAVPGISEKMPLIGGVLNNAGKLKPQNRSIGGTRMKIRGGRSSPLSDIARVELRKLTARWRASAGRGRTKTKAIACGNPVGLATQPASPNNDLHKCTNRVDSLAAQGIHAAHPIPSIEGKSEGNDGVSKYLNTAPSDKSIIPSDAGTQNGTAPIPNTLPAGNHKVPDGSAVN